MQNKWLSIAVWVTMLICLAGVTSACSSAVPQLTVLPTVTASPRITPLPAATATFATPFGDGDTIMRAQCATCHILERTTTSRKTRDQWMQTMNRMVKLSAADQAVLLDHLAQNYGQ